VTEKPRVGVGIIIRRGEEVLLIRREHVHGSGSWSTPGGHLDFGESPEACAVREAEEETGIVVAHVRYRAITNDIFEAEGRHYVTIWLEGEYREGEPVVNAPHEMSEVGWFRWDDLPSPLFLPLANLLEGHSYPPPPRPSTERPRISR
jgi:8-oxo-dGTP diphosphatase